MRPFAAGPGQPALKRWVGGRGALSPLTGSLSAPDRAEQPASRRPFRPRLPGGLSGSFPDKCRLHKVQSALVVSRTRDAGRRARGPPSAPPPPAPAPKPLCAETQEGNRPPLAPTRPPSAPQAGGAQALELHCASPPPHPGPWAAPRCTALRLLRNPSTPQRDGALSVAVLWAPPPHPVRRSGRAGECGPPAITPALGGQPGRVFRPQFRDSGDIAVPTGVLRGRSHPPPPRLWTLRVTRSRRPCQWVLPRGLAHPPKGPNCWSAPAGQACARPEGPRSHRLQGGSPA